MHLRICEAKKQPCLLVHGNQHSATPKRCFRDENPLPYVEMWDFRVFGSQKLRNTPVSMKTALIATTMYMAPFIQFTRPQNSYFQK